MGLSVYTYYETFKPHFSFRFKVDFLSNPSLYRLVQDIKLPSISINASDGKKRFGQTQFVLPFFEFGDQELEITFIETDTMKVLDYLTNNYNWPNLPNTEDIIVTEYDDTLRNVLKRTKYTITLFSYNAPQWQNSGSPSNMTITATYIVRSSRDITKDEYDLYNLPIYSPVVDMVQDMNVIGSSVDEGSAESEWQKFLGSLKDEETELEKNAELNAELTRQRKEAGQKAMMVFTATETNTKAKEKEKIYYQKKQVLDDSIAASLKEKFYNKSSEEQQAAEIEAFKRYYNQESDNPYRDFSMATDEEKAAMRKKFDNLSQTEKMLLIYDIDTADGLNENEINTIKNAVKESVLKVSSTNEEAEEFFNTEMSSIAENLKEMEDARKEMNYAIQHPEQGKGGEKQTGTIPQQAGGALAQRLSGHALNEYNEYISKMKAKYKDFDENKDAFIFFDIASNTKYAVKNGQIVKEYNAYTAVNDPTKGAGEATEGVYVISEETGKGGKHKSRQNNAINGIKSFGLDVDVISQEVASGKYKNVREAIKGHGVSEEKIKAWENSHKDTSGSTMKASQGHWDYLNYSTYSKNQIDEGNGNTGRENQGAYGIHSHVNYKENDKKVLEYEKKKAAGTNTVQDDLEIRKYLSKSKATEGCSIMTSQDIAWESEFIKDNGKIYQFNANGTSSYNKNNDKNIDIAQANNKNNKVNV